MDVRVERTEKFLDNLIYDIAKLQTQQFSIQQRQSDNSAALIRSSQMMINSN